jgi:crotonobetainyl-CoA:carnitine CoA-transferase CaiB-like acyl-CoA transferase
MADLARLAGGTPHIAPTILADKVCGQFIVNGVLAALVQRAATGRGAQLEISMVDAMRSFMLVEHGSGAISLDMGGSAGYRRVLNRFRGPQQTSDGWIHVMPYSVDAYAAVFCEGGRPELVEDDRVSEGSLISEAEWLYEQLHDVLRTKRTDHWMKFCTANHIPVGEVASLDDLVAELPVEQHPVAGAYRAIPSSLGPVGASPVRRHAPVLGKDTRHVFAEVGYSETDIDDLLARRVIRVADEGS